MTNNTNEIRTAVDFLKKVREEDEVKIKFIKKDGSERIMKCTLDFNKVPRDKHPKDVNLSKILNLLHKSKIIHVFDLDKNDWRSVPYNSVEWLETSDNKRLNVIN